MEIQRFFLSQRFRHVIMHQMVSGLMICNVLVLKAFYQIVLKILQEITIVIVMNV